MVNINQPHVRAAPRRKALAQYPQILRPGITDNDATAAIQKERSVIANPGTKLQHAAVRQIQAKRCKVLLAALIVPQVMIGMKLLQRARIPAADRFQYIRNTH
jgi:hypothetical protein